VERAYNQSTRLMGALIAVLGVVMVVTTLARGGGPLALGVVLGVLFAVLGSARVYLAGGLRSPRGGRS
jgi:drug/metabolite transporter (DMT)-like permease